MKAGLQFEDSLTAALEAMPTELSRKVLTDALLAAAEPIRAEAGQRARRRTGALAANVITDALSVTEVERSVEFIDEAVVEIGPNVPHFYGYFEEYGTATQPARPWFRPAFENRASVALSLVASRLWDAIRAAAGSSGGTRGRSTGGGLL